MQVRVVSVHDLMTQFQWPCNIYDLRMLSMLPSLLLTLRKVRPFAVNQYWLDLCPIQAPERITIVGICVYLWKDGVKQKFRLTTESLKQKPKQRMCRALTERESVEQKVAIFSRSAAISRYHLTSHTLVFISPLFLPSLFLYFE